VSKKEGERGLGGVCTRRERRKRETDRVGRKWLNSSNVHKARSRMIKEKKAHGEGAELITVKKVLRRLEKQRAEITRGWGARYELPKGGGISIHRMKNRGVDAEG